ncbi:Folylpolyglutamate synthase [Lachnellula suecica]|uniref:tetrahydrofolate synthase n=1 Tax=Lachnellula suecica TaxID=602035 RepID=A0A8T9CBA2_9HELO|nr:Folylpolyglutamate synthase [Lachnellula suecica]
MSLRTYDGAIDSLNSLQTPFAVLKERREAGIRINKNANNDLRTINNELDDLNIVHVAGTKGKGSTCAYVDSILGQYRKSRGFPSKHGLFTSPHLISVRERIRINSAPISEVLFAKYFFEVWDKMEVGRAAGMPEWDSMTYFRFLTLLSYHVFLREDVKVAVYETGVGGEYDSTNIVDRPAVTGLSTLGIDHTYTLGDTLESIAWHKGGIQKEAVSSFTVKQRPEAMEVVQSRALEKKVLSLNVVDECDQRLEKVKIYPDADFQRTNAALAVELANTVLRKLYNTGAAPEEDLPKEFVEGLEQVVWRGRCEKKVEDNITWYLDGAHTADSIVVAAKWFADECSKNSATQVLIFNQQGERESIELLENLFEATKNGGVKFDHVVFCPNVLGGTSTKKDFVDKAHNPDHLNPLALQMTFAQRWQELNGAQTSIVKVLPSVVDALTYVRDLDGGYRTEKISALITGSVRLIGTALSALEGADATLQSNRTIRAAIADAPQDQDPNRNAIPEMLQWARRAGYESAELGRQGQRYIHVAGTKGKGSVSVMAENILLQYRRPEVGRIGLYTSPHLVTVRERIRIDGKPISESLFTRYFYELWDRFEKAVSNEDSLSYTGETRPGYFRYLTLLAIHAFIQEGVKTAIMECGIGGEYDSTNMLPADAVAVGAITRLGIDHTAMLGETIEEIAWHKAGIMKKGAPMFTVEQLPEAYTVLENRAKEKEVQLEVTSRLPELETGELELGLLGDFQKDNASLAVAVAASYLRGIGVTQDVPPTPEPTSKKNTETQNEAVDNASFVVGHSTGLPARFQQGLETVKWPGRCEIRKDGNIDWLIDGAHTIDSIAAAARWFRSKMEEAFASSRPPTTMMLIFNQEDRDGSALLQQLFTTLTTFDPLSTSHSKHWFSLLPIFRYAAFPTNEPFAAANKGRKAQLPIQTKLADDYRSLDRNSLHMVYGSVEEAVDLAVRISEGEDRAVILVTGSLHLVGGLLQVLEKRGRILGDGGDSNVDQKEDV